MSIGGRNVATASRSFHFPIFHRISITNSGSSQLSLIGCGRAVDANERVALLIDCLFAIVDLVHQLHLSTHLERENDTSIVGVLWRRAVHVRSFRRTQNAYIGTRRGVYCFV